MLNAINIIARRPCCSDEGTEYIVVDRGEGRQGRFVSATANARSLADGEWFWGHYFRTRNEALEHFITRKVRRP